MINVDEVRQYMERLNNKELISIILEHDENQWQPEVFDIVEAVLRERGLSAGKDLKYAEGPESVADETEGLNLMTVAEYVSHLDAEADRLILENEGVKAWIFASDTVPAEGTPPSVQLKVCAEDWRAAMARLASEDMLFPELPDDIAEPPCPRCGSGKVTEQAEIVEEFTLSGRAPQKQEWFYCCASCGHKWSER